MKRLLIYLAIFSLFFWITWATFAYLTTPTDQQNHLVTWIVTTFLVLLFGAILCTSTLIISAIKATRPNQKLPDLLVRDSLIQGLFVAVGITGLLVLQLLRVASLINIALWLVLVVAVDYTIKIGRDKQGGGSQPKNLTPRNQRLK